MHEQFDPFDLGNDSAFAVWKKEKIDTHSAMQHLPVVRISNLAVPSDRERAELARRCRAVNFALYEAGDDTRHDTRGNLRGFCDALGLKIAEKHRSAGEGGIVALSPTDDPDKKGFIPYSQKALNWHTDGYYNPPGEEIRAMALHCVRPAADGGENQLLDPDIAYIRLRDINPRYIEALSHPSAMTIPAYEDTKGETRAASTGPVFLRSDEGALTMRYTARTRSIHWRDDPMTRKAAQELIDLLCSDEPCIARVKLAAGQGVLCNNVLHNRTGFDAKLATQSDRLLFRIRFHNRVKEN